MKFIEERFHTLESVEGERNELHQRNEKHVLSVTKSPVKCVICKQQQHAAQHCDQFKKLSAGEKYKVVKRNQICVNCLSPTHQSKQCKSKHSCFTCEKKHHTLLHNDEWANKKENAPPANPQVLLIKSEKKGVLLPTAIVHCYDKDGAIVKLRALIDQCAQASLITENGAQLLHASKRQLDVPITAVGDAVTATTRHYINLIFNAENTTIATEALILKKISRKQPTTFIQIGGNIYNS